MGRRGLRVGSRLAGGRRRRGFDSPRMEAIPSELEERMRCAIAVVPWAQTVLPRSPERKSRARNSFPAEIGNLEALFLSDI